MVTSDNIKALFVILLYLLFVKVEHIFLRIKLLSQILKAIYGMTTRFSTFHTSSCDSRELDPGFENVGVVLFARGYLHQPRDRVEAG